MKFIKKFETHDPDYLNYMNSENKILPNLSYCEDVGDVHLNPWTDPRVIAKFNVTDTSSATNIMHSSATSTFSEIEIDGVVQPRVVSSYTFDTTGEHVVKYTLADPTTIAQNAFRGCNGITSIIIPDSVTSIGDRTFFGTNLTSIKVNSNNSVYDSRNNCNAIIETATNTLIKGCDNTIMPTIVTSIGAYAFYNCSGFTSITIPNTVTTIGNSAFLGCTSLTSVTIGSGVTTIGVGAFQDCNAITNVTIGNSVTTIGDKCFYRNTNLTNITSLATTAPTISTQTFAYVKTSGTLTVPTGSTGYDVWMGTGNYYLGQYSWTKVEQ